MHSLASLACFVATAPKFDFCFFSCSYSSRLPIVTGQSKKGLSRPIDILCTELTTAWDNGKRHDEKKRDTIQWNSKWRINSISCDVATIGRQAGRACATGRELTIIRHFQLRWPLLHLYTFSLFSCQEVLSLSVLNDVELNGNAKVKQKMIKRKKEKEQNLLSYNKRKN